MAKDLHFIRRYGKMGILWFILVVLFVLWLLGMVTANTFGGWIYILLVVAVVLLIINLIARPRTVL